MPVPWLESSDSEFPPVEQALADPNGLLAASEDLNPQRLLKAYQLGIFPWYETGQPVLWWSPDPRLVLIPEQLRVSRSLKRLIRRKRYKVSMDSSFSEVIEACAESRRGATGTWITDEVQGAYTELHQQGIAHSVEVWSGSLLVGGLYGVALGNVFFGESMFSREDNTSKIALVHLVEQLQRWGFELIDCQVSSDHLFTLGATEIKRDDFGALLKQHLSGEGKPGPWELEAETESSSDEL